MDYQNYRVTERKNLRDLVLESAQTFADRTAFLEKRDGVTVSYSYAKLGADVSALAAAFQARGFSGQRVLIAGQNCYSFVLAFLSVAAAGGCAVPADRNLSAEDFCALAARTEAKAVLLSPDFMPKADRLPASVRRFSLLDLEDLIDEGYTVMRKRNFAPVDPAAESVAAIFFTAGTGRGVMLSHHNLCFDITAVCRMIEFQKEDVFLSVLPVHHIYEMTCGVLLPIFCGALVAFSEGLRYLTREMKEYHPTILNCVPYLAETMYHKVQSNIRRQGQEKYVQNMIRITNAIHPQKTAVSAKRRVFSFVHRSFGGHLRLILTFGAPADATVMRGFRDFGILTLQAYSLVECSPVAAINRDRFYRAGAAGLPLPNTVLDIYDMNEEGLGEIRCKGDHIMLGYFDDPKMTKSVLRGNWFYTGDLGYFDTDGFLHVIGRKKNMVISASGKKIFPEEIEALLNESKFIRESLVRVVPDQSAERVHVEALIVPDSDAVNALEDDSPKQRTNLEIRAAVSEINQLLPPFKRIKRYATSSSALPRTPSGRLQRD